MNHWHNVLNRVSLSALAKMDGISAFGPYWITGTQHSPRTCHLVNTTPLSETEYGLVKNTNLKTHSSRGQHLAYTGLRFCIIYIIVYVVKLF